MHVYIAPEPGNNTKTDAFEIMNQGALHQLSIQLSPSL